MMIYIVVNFAFSSSFFALIVLSITVASAVGLVLYFEAHLAAIPVFILVNVLLSWYLLKNIILKSFLFSYGQGFITNRELKSLNERYCEQYQVVLEKVKGVI